MVYNTAPQNRPDDTTVVAGSQGSRALQDTDGKGIFAPGGTQANRDHDIDGVDIGSGGQGDYKTGVKSVGGASAINMFIRSADSKSFEVKIELYKQDGETKIETIDKDDISSLGSGAQNRVKGPFAVDSDHVQVIVSDTSSSGSHTINGSINFNGGAQGFVRLQGADGREIQENPLNSTPGNSEFALVTWGDRAAQDLALDEIRTRVHDSAGVQVDPRTDEFAFAEFSGVDINSSTQTIDFTGGDDTMPGRADTISVFANPSGDAHANVVFYDDANKTTALGSITSSENSDLSSTGGSVITAEVFVATPFVEVDFVDDQGAANSTNGSAYGR